MGITSLIFHRLRSMLNMKLIIAFLGTAGYFVVSALVRPVLGEATVDLSVFPVILVSWLLGPFAGIGISLLIAVEQLSFRFSSVSEAFHPDNMERWATGLLTLFAISILTGWVRSLKTNAQLELVERLKAETALRKSEQRYKLLFENMVDALVLNHLIFDENNLLVDWEFQEANPMFERITRTSRKTILGKRASLLLKKGGSFTFLREMYAEAIQTGEPVVRETRSVIQGKDLKLTAVLLNNQQLAVIFRDISEHIQMIEAERKQRRLAEALRDIANALTSTLELDDVLDRILVHIQQITSYDAVNIMLVDQDWVHVARHNGYAERGLDTYISGFNRKIDEVHGLRWMAEHHQPLVISDTCEEVLWMVFPSTAWIRSYAGLPILARGKLIGFLNFNSSTPGFFRPEHIERLNPFADQAALAILNAQIYEDTRQREHRLALINRVAHALNQPLELNTVLQVTVDCLAEALNLNQVGLALFNEHRERLSIAADHPAPDRPSLVGAEIGLDGNLSMEILLREKKSLMFEDAQQDDRLSAVRDHMVQRGVLSMLLVPVLARNEVIGTIGCDVTDSNRKFSREEIELAETITNLAAVRIEQARLFASECRRTQGLALLHVTSLDITKQNDMPALLQTVVERAVWLMGATGGSFYQADPERKELECRVSYNLDYNHQGSTVRFGQGAAGAAAATGKALIVENYAKWPDRLLPAEELDIFLSVASVPVMWHNKVIGVIQLTRTDPRQPFAVEDLEMLGLFSNQVAISLENVRLYNELQQVAIQDTLTGLYNRRGLFEVGEREIERARRFNRPMSVLMMDIDYFKIVNDTYGHIPGDQVLAGLAKVCHEHLRSIDIVGRYGGEEFTILLIESESIHAEYVANRLCHAISKMPIQTTAGDVQVTVSIGVAELDQEMRGLQDLVQAADKALYQAKHTGRNQVKVYG